uniref:Uncharacterized protein n=1 Tax=Aegilops tauschii subsp. strangulata TaxID=200361 RepID=A0A453MZP6_AEGTS
PCRVGGWRRVVGVLGARWGWMGSWWRRRGRRRCAGGWCLVINDGLRVGGELEGQRRPNVSFERILRDATTAVG